MTLLKTAKFCCTQSAMAKEPNGIRSWTTSAAIGLALVAPLTMVTASAFAQDEQPAIAAANEIFPEAESLFLKHVDAIGGKEQLEAIESTVVNGTFSMPSQGMEGKLTIITEAPNKFLLKIDMPGVGLIQQGYDGKTGWEINPFTGARVLKGKELEQVKLQADFNADLKFKDHYKEYETVDKVEFAGKTCYKVHTVSVIDTEADIYFDTESNLIVGMESTAVTNMGEIKSVTEMQEYKEFGGIKYPTKTVIKTMGQEQVLAIDKVIVDELEEGAFELPDQIKTIKENQPAEEEGEGGADESGGEAGG